MKPIIIKSDKFLDSISWFFKVGGITLFPFIIVGGELVCKFKVFNVA